jgi:hypothetical protein
MAVNDEFRSKRVKEISSFNARIHELRSALLPAVDVSVEKNREEDLEDFRLDMEAMLAAVIQEIMRFRLNKVNLKRCLQAMKQDCSEGQTEVLKKLSLVEAIVDASRNVSLMDLAGIEEVLNNSLSAFIAFLKSEIKG